MRLAIFGAGGFGRELLTCARADSAELPIVFVADEVSEAILGVPVITPEQLQDDDRLVIALGSSEARRSVRERLSGYEAHSLIAPTAVIGPGVEIGEGAVFCDFTMVTASATIGKQFQCNIYSYVAHDCVVGDYVTFAPKVCCNGNVHIGDGAYIGTGAVLKNGSRAEPLTIGAGAVVGMGAVVTKPVPAGAVVVGNPAKSVG